MNVTGQTWQLLTGAEKIAILYHAVIQNCRRWEKKNHSANENDPRQRVKAL